MLWQSLGQWGEACDASEHPFIISELSNLMPQEHAHALEDMNECVNRFGVAEDSRPSLPELI
jgi:hypothetical protein